MQLFPQCGINLVSRRNAVFFMVQCHGLVASNQLEMRSLMFIDHINEATCVLFQCQQRVCMCLHV